MGDEMSKQGFRVEDEQVDSSVGNGDKNVEGSKMGAEELDETEKMGAEELDETEKMGDDKELDETEKMGDDKELDETEKMGDDKELDETEKMGDDKELDETENKGDEKPEETAKDEEEKSEVKEGEEVEKNDEENVDAEKGEEKEEGDAQKKKAEKNCPWLLGTKKAGENKEGKVAENEAKAAPGRGRPKGLKSKRTVKGGGGDVKNVSKSNCKKSGVQKKSGPGSSKKSSVVKKSGVHKKKSSRKTRSSSRSSRSLSRSSSGEGSGNRGRKRKRSSHTKSKSRSQSGGLRSQTTRSRSTNCGPKSRGSKMQSGHKSRSRSSKRSRSRSAQRSKSGKGSRRRHGQKSCGSSSERIKPRPKVRPGCKGGACKTKGGGKKGPKGGKSGGNKGGKNPARGLGDNNCAPPNDGEGTTKSKKVGNKKDGSDPKGDARKIHQLKKKTPKTTPVGKGSECARSVGKTPKSKKPYRKTKDEGEPKTKKPRIVKNKSKPASRGARCASKDGGRRIVKTTKPKPTPKHGGKKSSNHCPRKSSVAHRPVTRSQTKGRGYSRSGTGVGSSKVNY